MSETICNEALPIISKFECSENFENLTVTSDRQLGPGHALAFSDVHRGSLGLDPCAVLQVPKFEIRDETIAVELNKHLGRTNDVVMLVHPEVLFKPFVRKALIKEIGDLKKDGVSTFVPLSELAAPLLPQGPVISRHRKTIATLQKVERRAVGREDTSRQALLEDARVAWSYLEKFTNKTTGLCPATVNFSPSKRRIHKTVTMWDVGSQINGLVAAKEIGFISEKAFKSNISLILRQIRGRTSQDRLLPQGWIRTDRHKWGNRNFDGCDAGRLLASLDNLRRHSDLNDQLEKLVGTWDLEKVIIDGRIHSVTAGELKTTYRSHCAHYSALAFRRWGLAVNSPYEVFSGHSKYDDHVKLLEVASKIGPLGAEPLLLEAFELGMSPESTYLADVLFSAQLEDFNETGRLIAVSEIPIDRAPWFTYQGLQLDARERTWALDTVGDNDQHLDPKFWAKNLAISSKAAYAWAAYFPNDHSRRLMHYIRDNARNQYGYASGIYNATGRVMKDYSDLNTNSVILQAISHTLSKT